MSAIELVRIAWIYNVRWYRSALSLESSESLILHASGEEWHSWDSRGIHSMGNGKSWYQNGILGIRAEFGHQLVSDQFVSDSFPCTGSFPLRTTCDVLPETGTGPTFGISLDKIRVARNKTYGHRGGDFTQTAGWRILEVPGDFAVKALCDFGRTVSQAWPVVVVIKWHLLEYGAVSLFLVVIWRCMT